MNGWFMFFGICLVSLQLGFSYPGKRFPCPLLRLKYGRVKTRSRMFAQFICNKGYILAGERYSKCTQGKWETPLPLCVRPNCQKVSTLKNGLIFPSHKGAVLSFFCEANYVLEGPQYAYCDDMKWNNHLPACLPTNTTPSMSCDFETDHICGWSHDLNHNFDWIRWNRKTPSGHLSTGPSYDHTKGPGGDGYYMYIEATTRYPNDTARLISPVYRKLPNNTCLEFYYHMYGSGIGELRIYLKKINDSWELTPDKLVYSREGNYGNIWLRAFAFLGPIDDQFQIIFEGIRGFSYVSDIAIDDVKLIENCQIEPEDTTTEQVPNTSTFLFETCESKCNTTDTDMDCSCQEDCIENNSCCVDYIVVCLLNNDVDTTVEDIETTTEINEDMTTATEAVTTLLPTVKIVRTFNTSTTILNVTKIIVPSVISLPTKPTVLSATALPTLKPPADNSSNELTTYPTKQFIKPKIIPTILRPIYPRTLPPSKWVPGLYPINTIKPIVLTVKTTTAPVLPTQINVSITTTPKTVTRISFLNDIATVADELTTEDLFIVTAEETFEKEYSAKQNHNLLTDSVAPIHEQPKPNNKTTVIAVLTVCFVVFGILGAIFFTKRYSSRHCVGVRRMRSGNGDSQCDVRFLTGDEILNFTEASPRD